jgi:uncharacterized YigZ family protein
VKDSDTYLTIQSESMGLYKEKGSKFIAFAFPVQTVADTKEHIERVRKNYHDAKHHCFAYVLDERATTFRSSDDGEPGHSAGAPILGQIRANDLTYALVIVVRYFGGKKLGISGLKNAYKSAAAAAIRKNNIVERQIQAELTVQFGYPVLDRVLKVLRDHQAQVVRQHMALSCTITLAVRLTKEKQVRAQLKRLAGLTIV